MGYIDLNEYAQAAILVENGTVLGMNALARHYLPQLSEGALLPDYLDLPREHENAAGTFCVGGDAYEVRRTWKDLGELFLFTPAAQHGLTRLQLDQALAQMRQFMSEFLVEVGPSTGQEDKLLSEQSKAEFSRSYHRMLRLMENMEHMNTDGGTQKTEMLDFAALCRQVTEQAELLLRETGTWLEYSGQESYLLVKGDRGQLRRMLLGLLSNSARAAQGGSICVQTQKRRGRAILRVTDSGGAVSQRSRMAMIGQDTPSGLPQPGSGAGLGMSVIRDIVRRHQGTLLVEWSEDTTSVVISLPTVAAGPYVSVQSPRLERQGGMSDLMVELSDVLPASLFSMEGLD